MFRASCGRRAAVGFRAVGIARTTAMCSHTLSKCSPNKLQQHPMFKRKISSHSGTPKPRSRNAENFGYLAFGLVAVLLFLPADLIGNPLWIPLCAELIRTQREKSLANPEIAKARREEISADLASKDYEQLEKQRTQLEEEALRLSDSRDTVSVREAAVHAKEKDLSALKQGEDTVTAREIAAAKWEATLSRSVYELKKKAQALYQRDTAAKRREESLEQRENATSPREDEAALGRLEETLRNQAIAVADREAAASLTEHLAARRGMAVSQREREAGRWEDTLKKRERIGLSDEAVKRREHAVNVKEAALVGGEAALVGHHGALTKKGQAFMQKEREAERRQTVRENREAEEEQEQRERRRRDQRPTNKVKTD